MATADGRGPLVFVVSGTWRDAGSGHGTATLAGSVTQAGTDRRLPVDGTLTVRLGRVVHTELHLHFGGGRITAAGALDLVPASPAHLVGHTQQLLGRVLHSVAALGRVGLPGTLEVDAPPPEAIEATVDLGSLLRVARYAVR